MVFDHRPLLATRLNMITGNYVASLTLQSVLLTSPKVAGEKCLEKQVVKRVDVSKLGLGQ